MTTLAELVAATPAYTRGAAVQALGGAGTWRIVYELANPSAGASVVWYDITDYVAGHRYERGADQPNGPYAASVATVDLIADDDSLAPWREDTSDVFGTHVALGAGLLIRCGLIRVVGTTVAEWVPRFTLRVESWSDASYAFGQVRRHTVVARDLLTGLVNVPVNSTTAENWQARVTRVVQTEAGWDFGLTIYGANLSGGSPTLLMANRDESANAVAELDATVGPAGVVWRTTRKGDMIVHPQPGDTWHAALFTGGATGTQYTWPATVPFSYLADDDPSKVAYAVDDNVADPFGFDYSEIGIVNRLIVNDDGPSPYDIDNATSIARYGYRPRSVTWQVSNDDVADDILARLDTAEIQARPMTTTVDLPGFMAAAKLDHLSPISIQHISAAGRSTVEGEGYVRSIVEQVAPGAGRVDWRLTIVADIDSTDEVAELNPVTGLAVSAKGSNFVTAGWTNPSQTITPTNTQVRIGALGSLWLTLDYPITAFTWLALDPSTTYTIEVRLIREVDGLITNVSPVRSVTFTTDPLDRPEVDDGGGGDVDVDFPDPDSGCTLEWKLERSSDGTTWTQVDSGTVSTAPWTITIDSSSFAAGYLYRVCSREVCSGVPGSWVCSDPFINACTTDASLTEAPYTDASLVLFVPELCPPDQIVEALSDVPAYLGPAFGGVQGTDTDVHIVTAADGIAAYNTAAALNGLNGDRTMSVRVTIGTQDTERIFQAGAMFLGSVLSGAGWKPRLVVLTAAGQTSIQGTTELALDTEYYLGATYTEATGNAVLYIDGTADNNAGSTPGPLTAALPVWTVGGPDESTITDAAVWSSVLTSLPAPPGPSGLVAAMLAEGPQAMWNFDEATGSVIDITTNGYDCTTVTAATRQAWTGPDGVDRARFSGSINQGAYTSTHSSPPWGTIPLTVVQAFGAGSKNGNFGLAFNTTQGPIRHWWDGTYFVTYVIRSTGATRNAWRFTVSPTAWADVRLVSVEYPGLNSTDVPVVKFNGVTQSNALWVSGSQTAVTVPNRIWAAGAQASTPDGYVGPAALYNGVAVDLASIESAAAAEGWY